MTGCEFCNRATERGYDGFQMCFRHYVLRYPWRNVVSKLIKIRDDPPHLIEDRLIFLAVMVGQVGPKEIEDCLGREQWFLRLKVEWERMTRRMVPWKD